MKRDPTVRYWNNWRGEKRHYRKKVDAVVEAYHLGLSDYFYYKKRNHYPPGKRHDEYERGWSIGESGDYEREYD